MEIVKSQEIKPDFNAKEFKDALKHLMPIISPHSPRNYGSAIYFDEGCMVATDGFRLSRVKIDGGPKGFCLSKSSCNLLKSVITQSNSEFIPLTFDDTNLTVTVKTRLAKLELRTSNIQYPNYKGVLPTSYANSYSMKVNQSDIDMIKEALAESDKSQAIKLNCFADDIGDNIHINGKYLLHAITGANGKVIEVKWNGSDDPVMIQYGSVEHLIVPIRQNNE
jgi:DNA polymerase III sliding clamp (beta) subunit (PCNA family)